MQINFPAELETLLTKRAESLGLSPSDYIGQLVRRDAATSSAAPPPSDSSQEPDGEYEELRESVI